MCERLTLGLPPAEGLDAAPGDAVAVTVEVEPATSTGGVVLATVRTVAARDVVLQGGVVSLGYVLAYRYLEGFLGASYGKTAKRAEQVAEQLLPGPTLLREGESVEQQVLLSVPERGPATVDSALVLLRWIVGARVRYDGTEHADAEPQPVRVLGDGQGSVLGGPEVVTGGRRPDVVTFENVSARRIGPGSRIAGEVAVTPGRSGQLKEVRVELALVQTVPHGPWLVEDPARNPEAMPNEVDTVVARRVVAESGEVAARGPVQRWSFTLDAPDPLPAPTLSRDEFTLRWVLRAVVERRRSRPTTAVLEVLGGTRQA